MVNNFLFLYQVLYLYSISNVFLEMITVLHPSLGHTCSMGLQSAPDLQTTLFSGPLSLTAGHQKYCSMAQNCLQLPQTALERCIGVPFMSKFVLRWLVHALQGYGQYESVYSSVGPSKEDFIAWVAGPVVAWVKSGLGKSQPGSITLLLETTLWANNEFLPPREAMSQPLNWNNTICQL